MFDWHYDFPRDDSSCLATSAVNYQSLSSFLFHFQRLCVWCVIHTYYFFDCLIKVKTKYELGKIFRKMFDID